MKKLYVLFAFLPLFGTAQVVNTQTVTSNIDAVKLYLTAGQMTHNQSVNLKAGRNKLIFSGISAYADPQSIQFLTNGDYRLVSVSTEMDFMAAEQFNPRISVLKDSMEMLKDKRQETQDMLDAYRAEEAVLNTNRDLGGESQNLTVAEIREAADFYRTRTLEIRRSISKLRKDKINYDKQIEDTRYQLVELNYNENQRSNQVIVLLDVAEARSAETTLKYLTSDCGWAATYDLSAKDINQQINLVYKAQVYNNTGNDWSDVDLTLSTADPHLSASHPELSPWYLTGYNIGNLKGNKYYAPKTVQKDYRSQAVDNINIANKRAFDQYYSNEQVQQMEFQSNSFKLEQKKTVGRQAVQMRQIDIAELSTEFKIENKFSCPADAKPYMVRVKEMNLDARFTHITVPKLDGAAFLLANIGGWQDLDLIPGPTNVYFGGVYVGVSEIGIRNVSDTLSLSFGRDNKVTVLRKLKKEYSVKKVIGNTKKESYMYEIAIRNNRNVPINIKVYDQIPISKNNDITVSVDEISEGVKDGETGEVMWDLNIPASGVSGKEIGYTVKYPKDIGVVIQRFRTVSSPSF